MTTYAYPNLGQYRLEKVDFVVLIRIAIISIFLLLIMLPLQLLVMVIYAPIAVWNVLRPAKYIKTETTPPVPADMQVQLT